jgi:salicylate hydroxylase
MRVAIAGAGIAGLANAIAIGRRHGASQIQLYEKQASLMPVGAGVQLGPNAFHALEKISPELAADLKARIATPAKLIMRDLSSDKTLSMVALGDTIQARFGQPYGMLHRASLQTALYEHASRLSNVNIQFDKPYEHADNSRYYDLVVGADGLWSPLRTALFGPASAQLSSIAFRAFAPCESVEKDVQLWVGEGAHIVAYPIAHPVTGTAVLNVAIFVSGAMMSTLDARLPKQDKTSWACDVSVRDVLSSLPQVSPALARLLPSLYQCSAWRVFDLERSQHWGKDQVVLVGDAAHAMLPHLAQGAAFGLEDAVALANLISPNKAPLDREAFELNRRARCWRAQQLASRYQRIYHAGGWLKTARNLVLSQPLLAPSFGGLSWVYGYR